MDPAAVVVVAGLDLAPTRTRFSSLLFHIYGNFARYRIVLLVRAFFASFKENLAPVVSGWFIVFENDAWHYLEDLRRNLT